MGVCESQCAPGFDDCDGNPANGCEVNLATSVEHCGVCANACPSDAANLATCTNGACGVQACGTGLGNCDVSLANGCEVNLQSSVSNCGTCGTACSGGCSAGVCVGPCTGGLFTGANEINVAGGVPGALTGTNLSKAIGAWIKPDVAMGEMAVFSLGSDMGSCGVPSCGGGRLDLFVVNGRVGVGTAQANAAQSVPYPTNQWVYAIAGFDQQLGGYFAGHVSNGVANIQVFGTINTVSTNFTTAGQSVKIGNNVNSNSRFKGRIDRVDVYSPAPTSAEFVQYAKTPNAMLVQLPKLYWLWSLDEGMGSSTSSMKNVNVGTLSTPSWWQSTSDCPF